MAITRTILNNGSKAILLHVYLENTGIEGELDKEVLVDPTVYDSVFTDRIIQADMKLTLVQLWYSFKWFDATLYFDDLSPVPCWVLPRDGTTHVDFHYFGGLSNRLIDPNTNQSTNRTGKVLISTDNFAPVGSAGTLILELRKSNNT